MINDGIVSNMIYIQIWKWTYGWFAFQGVVVVVFFGELNETPLLLDLALSLLMSPSLRCAGARPSRRRRRQRWWWWWWCEHIFPLGSVFGGASARVSSHRGGVSSGGELCFNLFHFVQGLIFRFTFFCSSPLHCTRPSILGRGRSK